MNLKNNIMFIISFLISVGIEMVLQKTRGVAGFGIIYMIFFLGIYIVNAMEK